MLNAYDGTYDAGCGAGCVFCCGVEPHPAAAMIASARAIRFMKPPYSLHLNAKTGDRISASHESASSFRNCWRDPTAAAVADGFTALGIWSVTRRDRTPIALHFPAVARTAVCGMAQTLVCAAPVM
jgi:hypothetical protein